MAVAVAVEGVWAAAAAASGGLLALLWGAGTHWVWHALSHHVTGCGRGVPDAAGARRGVGDPSAGSVVLGGLLEPRSGPARWLALLSGQPPPVSWSDSPLRSAIPAAAVWQRACGQPMCPPLPLSVAEPVADCALRQVCCVKETLVRDGGRGPYAPVQSEEGD